MDTATLDLYFQKFDEIIYDEGKIATWNLLAKTLKLPINEMPELFSNYLSDRRQLKPKDFAVTYCLCGVLKDQQKLDICCVDEDNLDKKRELFERVVKQQVYSIQKSKNIDFNAISLVDQIETNHEGSLPGSIVGKNCIKRSIKKKILPSVQTKPNNPLFNKAAKSEGTQDQTNSSSTSSSSSSQNKAQTNSKIRKNGGIANFFTKAPVKANLPKVEIDDSKSNIENNSDGKENDIKQPVIEDNSTKNNIQNNDKIIDIKEEQMEIEETTKKIDKERTNKKRKKAQKDEAPHKKRKRIQVINDSDSSDIFSDAEDVVEKTDDEPEPLSPPKPQLVSKNKVRKAVDKTYVDEEGFIITKTEYVFESASEDEKEAVPVKEEPKPKILEKKNSTTDSENDTKTVKGRKNKKLATGKQQTLMNFFKKL